MRLSTKGRYAVMAMADLAGMPPRAEATPRRPGRYRRAPGYFPVLSGTAVRQAAARRAGDQRARPRRRLSPVAPAANCASPTSSWRWTSPSPPPAARPAAPRAAPRPGRAASPMICGKSWASRFMFSCPRCRWPMWWRSGCWAAPSPATIMVRPEVRSGGMMHYLRSQRDVAVAPRSRDAIAHALTIGGNPSSVHAAGRAAHAVVEEARDAVAKLGGREIRSGDLHQRRHRIQCPGAVRARLKARWSAKSRPHHPPVRLGHRT
jgi:cysteine desulfurase